MITSIAIAFLTGQQSLVGKAAPELIGTEWLNVEKPLTIASRKGKVTLVHFWTFACINCKHNLPAVQHLTDQFKKDGVETISIHTPELAEEKDSKNVKAAVETYGIKYPVLIDREFKNWKAWGVYCWPTFIVIDKSNRIRGGWIGELNYGGHDGEGEMRTLIRKLLAEK